MTEKQLQKIYIKFHRAKNKELRLIMSKQFSQARDLATVADVELMAIGLPICFYFQSKFTKEVLEIADFNYKLGGNLKELIGSIISLQEKNEIEKDNYFKNNPDKQLQLVFRPKKLFGIPIPFTKVGEFKGEQNPYTVQTDLERAKTDEDIIKCYAELKATIYYYKRVVVKNKWAKGKIYLSEAQSNGRIINEKKIEIMTEIIAEIQKYVPEITGFLGKGLTSGLFSGIGKDLWEKIKGVFQSDKEKEVIEKFEANPDDAKQQGKVELLLEEKLSKMSQEELLEIFQLFQKAKAENPDFQNIRNSKNIVSNSNIFVNRDFHIGDKL